MVEMYVFKRFGKLIIIQRTIHFPSHHFSSEPDARRLLFNVDVVSDFIPSDQCVLHRSAGKDSVSSRNQLTVFECFPLSHLIQGHFEICLNGFKRARNKAKLLRIWFCRWSKPYLSKTPSRPNFYYKGKRTAYKHSQATSRNFTGHVTDMKS